MSSHAGIPRYLRIVLMLIMAAAFVFGFLDACIPLNFERLHIFLFNMTAGGFVILYYTRGERTVALVPALYLVLGVAYAVLAFLGLYGPAVAVSVPMWAIVESARVTRYGFFPKSFFMKEVPVGRKFHEASLLCLSLAFVSSTAVVLNSEIFHWFTLEKLKPDVFFLGFSFPVSLITMSIIFSIVEPGRGLVRRVVENGIFWIINLGVIVFFGFIVFELFMAEIIAASLLFAAVLVLFVYFLVYGMNLKQKHFLVSGMFFLLCTAFTGLLYIPAKSLDLAWLPKLLLKSHAYLSLYGWNLSGLFVLLRWNDFPSGMNSARTIVLHWAVILLAPAGKFIPWAVPLISGGYFSLLYLYFFTRNNEG